MNIHEGFLAQMREATQLLQTEGPMAATAAIQRALHGASSTTEAAQPVMRDINPPPAGTQAAADILARFRDYTAGKRPSPGYQTVEDVVARDVREARADVPAKGRFIAGTCTSAAGTRAYKLYIPSAYKGEPLPLVLMLHGCTQNPDDFATGTGMNAAGEESGCFVVYAEQTKNANGSQCWNWFQPGDQQRDQGEPSILAAITGDIASNYKVDTSRIYVAGLSAGGAMAVVLAATYPDRFAAVGIHSGLPYGIARDVPSAFAAMKRRKSRGGEALHGKKPAPLAERVPAIVFHGDRDTTVSPVNGEQVLAQCIPAAGGKEANAEVQQGAVPGGRTYTRTIMRDEQGNPVAEKWIVHGAGHAWSGGSRQGSYTDPKGPDASREMLRFFLTHRKGV